MKPESQTDSYPVRRFALAAILAWILIPAIFVYRFGAVTDLGWGFTIATSVFCLLVAIGLYFRNKPDFHSPVQPLHGQQPYTACVRRSSALTNYRGSIPDHAGADLERFPN